MSHISESSRRFPPYGAAEVSDLQREQLDFKAAVLHVRRVKVAPRAPTPCVATNCWPVPNPA
jgi:hypothetical protein